MPEKSTYVRPAWPSHRFIPVPDTVFGDREVDNGAFGLATRDWLGGANRWGPHSRLMVYWRLTSIKEVHENPQYLVHQKLSIDILGLTIKQNSLASTKFQSEESSRRPIHCKQCDLIELGYFTNEKFQRHLF